MSKKKKWLIAIAIIVLFFVSYQQHQQNLHQQEVERFNAEYDYKQGIDAIEKHNFKEANRYFLRFSRNRYSHDEKYKDGQVLGIYVAAKEHEISPSLSIDGGIDYAKRDLDQIPDDYNGQFADEIRSYKRYINRKLYENQERLKANQLARQKDKENHVYVGDHESKVKKVMGEPQRVNRTVMENKTREQWVYGLGHYIYIENGIVTSFQDSK